MAVRLKEATAVALNSQRVSVRALKAFYHGGGVVDGFGMARFYYEPGQGETEPIEPRVTRKRRPIAAGMEVEAARVEAIPPADAPQDYADVDFLVRHFQSNFPADETTAFVQVTLRFGSCANVHHPFEVARGWAKSFYVDSERVPVIMVLHAPYLSGSDADPHVHVLVMPRRASRMGWVGPALDLGSDAAEVRARQAWMAYRDTHMAS